MGHDGTSPVCAMQRLKELSSGGAQTLEVEQPVVVGAVTGTHDAVEKSQFGCGRTRVGTFAQVPLENVGPRKSTIIEPHCAVGVHAPLVYCRWEIVPMQFDEPHHWSDVNVQTMFVDPPHEQPHVDAAT